MWGDLLSKLIIQNTGNVAAYCLCHLFHATPSNGLFAQTCQKYPYGGISLFSDKPFCDKQTLLPGQYH